MNAHYALFLAVLIPLAANAQPPQPVGFLATAGDQEAVLTWWDFGNSAVMYYQFRFRSSESPQFSAWAEVPNSDGQTLGHTVSGLANGTRYVFEVRAVGDGGAGTAARSSTTLAASPSSAVEVPDAALATYMRAKLRLAADVPITQGDLAKLRSLDLNHHVYGGKERLVVVEEAIVDLSGMEFALNLARLVLQDNAIADLSTLSGLTTLQSLWLEGNKISDVSALAGLTSLADLRLSGNAISDISALSALTRLGWLFLRDNNISDLSALSGLTQLGYLKLSGNAISDISALSSLTTLYWLWLDGNAISDISALSGLTSLAWLKLNGNVISNVSPLSSLTLLRKLWLQDNAISDVSALSGLTSLVGLRLSNNAISTVSLTDLPSLAWLYLDGNAISNVSPLSSLTGLGALFLRDNDISDLSGLSGMRRLTGLWLNGNAISKVSLSALDLPSLVELWLHDNAISAVSLSGFPSLSYLSLSRNELSDVSGLSDMPRLSLLWLDGNALSDVSGLSGLAGLSALWLDDNELSDVSGLSSLTRLSALFLAANKLSDVSALSNLPLTDLALSSNHIADVSALSDLPLTRLYLDGNSVTDISPLGGLTQLSTLFLNSNAIADISPLAESRLFGEGAYVDLRGNPLNSAQADHVGEMRESGATVLFDDGGHRVPLFFGTVPKSARSSATGFVRVINHSDEPGSVSIEAVDEAGERRGPVSLAIQAGQALHFNAEDLEQGNPTKGLRGIGEMVGAWRLVLRSELDIEVLGYARTPDGFVTSLHDLVPEAYGISRVPTLNPGSNRHQMSRLRLANPTTGHTAWIEALDDRGDWRGWYRVRTPPDRTLDFTAAQLESGKGVADFVGIGDGYGKWRLSVDAPGQRVMSLLQSPTGHVANISTGTAVSRWRRTHYSWGRGGRYRVPLLLAASTDIQGFLRIVNLSLGIAAITLRTFDEAGVEREPVILTLKGEEALHLNSEDLEFGNVAKGLPGIGAGAGDWHLEVSADRRFEVLAYARTADGLVTSLHDVAPRAEDGSLWIPFFNPGSNRLQASRLRLVNWGETAAEATIIGIDDAGNSPGDAVRVSVPARSARDYMAWELETGEGAGLSGALGDGEGKWRLRVSTTADVEAMSLLGLPTGHITNLSTTPRHRPK